MARVITKELALKIVKKLKARKIVSRSKAHDLYAVEYQGRIIAVLSIRRGSQKDMGHDYLPRDLRIGPHAARLLGQCPLKREDYFRSLEERGLL